MKLPWSKWFWSDWIRDTRRLSLAGKGAWIDLLAYMQDSSKPGYLLHPNGTPFSDEDIARAISSSLDEAVTAKQELIRLGVCSVNKRGILFSRRLAREADTRAGERIRKAESRRNATKPLSDQRKCPEFVRDLSGDCPGEKSEVRYQISEARRTMLQSLEPSPLETVAAASAARHPNRQRSASADMIAQALISAGATEGEMLDRWEAFHARYSADTAEKFAVNVLRLIADGAWKIAQPEVVPAKPSKLDLAFEILDRRAQ